MKKNNAAKARIFLPEEARAIALQAQGLDRFSPFGKGKAGALAAIRHLSYVQLDTLAVVARAHHHTLWSRVPGYDEKMLDRLMHEKKIFEYWSHAAAFLPMEDFRFSLVRKQEFLDGESHWFAKDKRIMKYVLDRIRREGPLQARDFETDRPRGSWFDWKPAKIALEQLFHDGSLMVTGRKGFQKIYDITERVLPTETDTRFPSRAEYAAYLVRSAIQAQGIASVKDMTHLRRGMTEPVARMLRQLESAGEIIKVKIEEHKDDFYMQPGAAEKIPAAENPLRILSPFDNAIIRRDRVLRLFNYDFRVEFYLPESKRQFGYFCLPVLYKGNFIGRFDPKADRKEGIFYVKKFHAEHKIAKSSGFRKAFKEALMEFAAFNGCSRIVTGKD